MDDYRLHTPEQVDISYTLAGVGSRFMAMFIDSLIQGALIFVVLFTMDSAADYRQDLWEWYIAISIIVLALVYFGYYFIAELLMKGRTPGKAAMRIRVSRMDGQAVDTAGIMLRNLVRIVDALPVCYVVGIITMFVNRDSRRLGDLAAGTVVIVERKQAALKDILSAQVPGNGDSSLSNQEYAVIRDFLARRAQLTPEAKLRLAASIAAPFYNKMGVPMEGRQDPEGFLCGLMNAPNQTI